MKIVEIRHRYGMYVYKNKQIWGVCDYDDHLLNAYLLAKKMAGIVRCDISDFRYRISEKTEPMGMVFSGPCSGSKEVACVGFLSDFTLNTPPKSVNLNIDEWIDFESINVDEYERSICFPEEVREDIF